MNHISLDIETYSSVDLNKSSVYRYSEAPDFEILLLGYSVDDNPVQVVDLASGERIPEEILAALTDERVIKWAFNANFERVCLSRYLGMPNDEFLDPAQWRCTMIWSAYLGLPLSLMGVGAALALDKQKLSKGKELIRYFCQPCAATKANGGRTRNLPQDAPEKWTLFKAYNLRDVETEIGIQKRLRRYPVPEDVWEQYHQDQEIKAQRFKALKKVRPLCSRVIGLTGTPAPNTLIDLWPQMYVLDMGQRLGRFLTHYRERFFVPDKRNREIVYSYKLREGAEQKIYELIGDICISMKATDHLKMPELTMNRVEVHLSAQEQKLYDTLKREMILQLKDGEIDAVNAAALSGKLLQMANGAVYDSQGRTVAIHDRKLDALEDLVEAANGKPVLVAYWFKHDLARIQKRFPESRVIDTSRDISDWNAGRISMGLLHPASGGHGLNLQEGGSTVIWYGLTWSLELYQQLNARLWRQGQSAGAVVVHHIVSVGTHDEDVMRALERKDVGQAGLIAAVKAQMEVSHERKD